MSFNKSLIFFYISFLMLIIARHIYVGASTIAFAILIIAFWLNNSERYSKIIMVSGMTMNFLAVAANHGRMPVIGNMVKDYSHSNLSPLSRLPSLCDIFYLYGFGLFSIGDIFICSGLIIYCFALFSHWRK